MAHSVLKIGLAAAAAALVFGGVQVWRATRVESIPAALDPLPPVPADRASTGTAYVVPGTGDAPDLRLSDHAGKTVFLVVEGMASMRSGEGRTLGRALNRWVLPDTTVGFMVGDAEGLGVFRTKAAEFVGAMGAEFRFPLYVDFEGVTTDRFKLPKGHSGLVILDPDGQVALRHSGAFEPADLHRVAELLGAEEPKPGEPAPAFTIGPLTRERCGGYTCVLAFLGRDVRREEVPGVEGGYAKKGDEARAHLSRPEIRLASAVAKLELAGDRSTRGVLVGRVDGVPLDGWESVTADPDLGTPFGIGPDETAVIVIDPQGRLVYDARGVIRMYQWDRIAELLGVDPGQGFAQGPPRTDQDGAQG